MGLSHGIKIWTDFAFVLSQTTRLRRTDRILIARPHLHCMQRGRKKCGHPVAVRQLHGEQWFVAH